MRAEVISISSLPRQNTHLWREEAQREGFTKALGVLKNLKECNMRETIIALENWETSGLLSKEDVDDLFQFHGWRRGE